MWSSTFSVFTVANRWSYKSNKQTNELYDRKFELTWRIVLSAIEKNRICMTAYKRSLSSTKYYSNKPVRYHLIWVEAKRIMRKELAGNSKHRNVAEIDTHYLQRIITIMHGCEVCALLSLSLVILHFLGLANNSAKGSLLLGAERETCVSFCSFKVKFAESMLKFCFAL